MKRMGIILALACLPAALAAGAGYRWPLPSSRELSSSFAERREGRYHAGIDLRTYGRIGLPCVAVGGGWVSRIRVSPAGYGKSVYLALDDGRTAVYAHLDGFAPELDSLTYFWRLAHRTNWCDLRLRRGEFRFSAGETLCYSGTSGSIAPHLHFELRDERERPLNPLIGFYQVPDSRSPTVHALEIVPLGRGSIASGSPLPVTKRFRPAPSGAAVLEDTLFIAGSAGFGVCAWDEQGQGSYWLAPASFELLVDGARVYRVENRELDYERIGEIVFEQDEFGTGPRGRFQLLFRAEGLTTAGREGSGVVSSGGGPEGALTLADGIHRGEIVARDAAGNESRGRFVFVTGPYPTVGRFGEGPGGEVTVEASDPGGAAPVVSIEESTDGGATWTALAVAGSRPFAAARPAGVRPAAFRCTIRGGRGARIVRHFAFPRSAIAGDSVRCAMTASVEGGLFALTVESSRILAGPPSIASIGRNGIGGAEVRETGPGRYVALFPVDSLRAGANLFAVDGADWRGTPLHATFGRFLLPLATGEAGSFSAGDSLPVVVRAGEMIGTALCIVGGSPSPPGTPAGLAAFGRPFTIDLPLDRLRKPLRLEAAVPADVCLFRWNPAAGWRFVGVPAAEDGAVEIGSGALYAFFRDSVAAQAGHLVINRHAPQASGFYSRRLYTIPVREDGSGVNPYSVSATLNGRTAVCEYDEYRHRLVIPIPADFPRGSALLSIEFADRAGNRSSGEWRFVVE